MSVITDKEREILEILAASNVQMYGYELIQNNAINLGTAYVLLRKMERKGFVESEKRQSPDNDFAPPRRYYKVTKLGRDILKLVKRIQA